MHASRAGGPSNSAASFRFGSFELQVGERRLLAGADAVGLGPRGFDVLALLIERAGHLVTKDELFQRVWPKVVVDDSALQFQISGLRKIVGATAIATVSGRGYRFMLPVVRGDRGAACDPLAHNLQRAGSSFVGRERDLERLSKLLDRTRLLTLTGAGGCGKTRLAVELASRAVDRYADGVRLVELAALADGAHVPRALMSALGVHELPSAAPLDALVAHLGAKRLLLLLDNAEHLLGACAELVDYLLQLCPALAVLVTSRQALGVTGEQTYRVPSLSVPDPQQRLSPEALLGLESARLFVERARLLRPHFAVTPQNASALALVCWRLDGIPLAIELAAGRMRSMSVEELSQRLNQRFSLLTGGANPALPRHRTLRSLIDWSYDLLSRGEQDLLCRLSVFAGSWTLEAAERVCSDEGADARQVLDLLAALVDKNLLLLEEHDAGTRYRMLETVRQYARERLREGPDEAAWQDRHWAYYVAMARQALPHTHGPEQIVWLDRFEADNDNLRAALSWARASGNTVEGLRMAGVLSHFWIVRGYLTEARTWFASLLAAAPPDHSAKHRGIALGIAGTLAMMQGDYAAARAFGEEALRLFQDLGDPLRVACAVNNLGAVAEAEGDFAAAERWFVEALAMFRAGGYEGHVARELGNLGNLHCLAGDTARARTVLDESLALCRRLDLPQGVGMALSCLGTVALLEGRHGDARGLLDASLSVLAQTGDRQLIVRTLEELAQVCASTGRLNRAARLWGAAEQQRDAMGLARPLGEVAEHARRRGAARTAAGDDPAFERAWQEGRTLTFEQAVEFARAPVDT